MAGLSVLRVLLGGVLLRHAELALQPRLDARIDHHAVLRLCAVPSAALEAPADAVAGDGQFRVLAAKHQHLGAHVCLAQSYSSWPISPRTAQQRGRSLSEAGPGARGRGNGAVQRAGGHLQRQAASAHDPRAALRSAAARRAGAAGSDQAGDRGGKPQGHDQRAADPPVRCRAGRRAPDHRALPGGDPGRAGAVRPRAQSHRDLPRRRRRMARAHRCAESRVRRLRVACAR